MKNLLVRPFLILSLFLFSPLGQAVIKVQIDPSKVTMGKAFKLSFILEDTNSGVPDLSPLQKEFVILGTERNVNYSIINGQTQLSNQWVVALRAKKAGLVTIPAIQFGQEKSDPINITIEEDKTAANQNPQDNDSIQQDVLLVGKVNNKNPYINQQITYNVKLYHSKHLLDASYQGPQVKNALVIPLGEEKHYQTVKNDINYIVEEQNYAIFPQKSGTLNILSPIFTALIYDFDTKRVKAQDKIIHLDVQPIPKQYTDKAWLPAKRITLSDKYENSNQVIKQGSTLIRTVTIQGIAIPAQLLPIPNFTTPSDAFNVYPEKGAERNQLAQGELIGSTEIKITYLFNKAESVVIPELRLPWFNTETGKEEVAILAPRSLEIKPGSLTANNQARTVSLPTPHTSAQASPKARPALQSTNYFAWLVALLFALAWIITLSLWAWQKRIKKPGKKAYKKALEELNKACVEANPEKARDALLKWAALYWPDASLLNLSELAQLVNSLALKKQIHLLFPNPL